MVHGAASAAQLSLCESGRGTDTVLGETLESVWFPATLKPTIQIGGFTYGKD